LNNCQLYKSPNPLQPIREFHFGGPFLIPPPVDDEAEEAEAPGLELLDVEEACPLTLLAAGGAGAEPTLAAARREVPPEVLADDVDEEEELVLAPPPELLDPAEEGFDRPEEAAGGGAVLLPPPGTAGAGAFDGADGGALVAAGGALDADDEAPLLADDDPLTEADGAGLEDPPEGALGPVVALAPSMTGALRSFILALAGFSFGFFVMSLSTAVRPGSVLTAGGRTLGGGGGAGGGIVISHVIGRNDADWLNSLFCSG